jgi:hypothetical protein
MGLLDEFRDKVFWKHTNLCNDIKTFVVCGGSFEQAREKKVSIETNMSNRDR